MIAWRNKPLDLGFVKPFLHLPFLWISPKNLTFITNITSRMKKLLLGLVVTVFSVTAFTQTATFIEEVLPSKNGELVIPYKKYKLANGLTIILHEDHSDPIVHVECMYHVGSARELVGRSGFAHFFEHMMFQGSEHVKDEEHFKIVTESGGRLNGTTNLDRTTYFETLPSNQLETALWLEADRMGWFLDSATQKKFDIQRATVKNERGQNYDNRPYGLVGEKAAEALYPFGHPYSWLTIGYIDDLNAATLDDLKRFFLRWYSPNNATLVVAGDIDMAKTLAMIEKYYSVIPSGPEVKNMASNVPVLDKDRYVSYEDNIRFPMMRMTFPTVPARHVDEAPLDILADVFGGGNNSILYQNMVKTQKALSSNSFTPTNELSGEFIIAVRSFPTTGLADMLVMVRQAMKDFETRGVTDDDIKKFVATHEAGEISGLQSVSSKGSKLAYYQTFVGNPNYLNQDLERYKKVTKEDVMRVYNTYIKNKFAVILSVVPKGKPELAAGKDNYSRPKAPNGYKNDLSEYEKLTYNKAKYPFDANYRPTAGIASTVNVPVFWTQEFDNGLKMIGTDYSELPMVALTIGIKAGHMMEPAEKSGLANLLAQMMNEGSANYTPEDLSKQLDMLGSDISVFAGREEIVIQVTSLKINFDKTVELLKEVMFKPRFDQADFDRIKKQTLENIMNQKTQATTIADNVLNGLLFGGAGVIGTPTSGTETTVPGITLDDVKAHYNNYFAPNITNMVFVGNITKKEVVKKLAFLNTWTRKEIKIPGFTKATEPDKTTLYFIDKKDAAQSEIRVVNNGLPFDATGQFYRAQLMNYALGGAFNCRLNLNLREAKGYTYGVRSGFSGNAYTGVYRVSGGFLAHATDSCVMEIMKELDNYKNNGIKVEELVFTQNSISQNDALKYETLFQKAGFMGSIIEYGLNKDFVKQQQDILKKITQLDINQLAKTMIHTEKATIVVVGDKAKVFDKLKKLPYPIIELDATGKPLQ
jgi:zinc protease